MTAYERQQRILGLLRERQGIKNSELAELLGVSRGTIRNDLLALEEQALVRRVRGGAVPLNGNTAVPAPASAPRAEPEQLKGKQRIARWASELVADGDAIFLGAGTTVQQMVPFLAEKRDLTILTNGLDVAQALKRQTRHNVIVLGGVLLERGHATGGLLNSDVLQHLNIHTAFVSGSGFTREAHITERTLEEAELKKRVLARALQTAVLMDSNKLNKVGRFPFAELHEIAHFYTDKEVSPELREQMHNAGVNLMVCGKMTVRSYSAPDEATHYTIGFANQSEALPFAVEVRRGLERAAAQHKNIDLIIADNKLSGEEALRVADRLIERRIDLAIEYQIDFNIGSLIMNKFQQANIPAIAVDIPMVGATYVGVDNYRVGHIAGVAMGEWLAREWAGSFDRMFVLEEPRAGVLPATRIQGQLDGVAEVLGEIPQEKLVYLDSGNTTAVSEANVRAALQALPGCRRIAILSFNTESASGALRAAQSLGREEDVVIVGQGADRLLRDEIRRPGSRIIGSTVYMPERYGEHILGLAIKILRGEPVPPAVYTEHAFLTAENMDQYYPAA